MGRAFHVIEAGQYVTCRHVVQQPQEPTGGELEPGVNKCPRLKLLRAEPVADSRPPPDREVIIFFYMTDGFSARLDTDAIYEQHGMILMEALNPRVNIDIPIVKPVREFLVDESPGSTLPLVQPPHIATDYGLAVL